jgi:hypothetical protein
LSTVNIIIERFLRAGASMNYIPKMNLLVIIAGKNENDP